MFALLLSESVIEVAYMMVEAFCSRELSVRVLPKAPSRRRIGELSKPL